MMHFTVELISNRSFVLKTSDGQQSSLRRLKNGVLQGSGLAHDLPDTISKKYGYADDLAILTSHRELKKIEITLSQDMSTLALYLRQWWLKLSKGKGKTVSTVFHLNNKEAKRELDVYIDSRRLNFQPTTTLLGVKLDRTFSYR